MYGALLYLRAASLCNLARARVRRLRQPKYLFGAAAGAAYFYLFFWRRFAAAPSEAFSGPAAIGAVAVAGGALVAAAFWLGRILLGWLAPVGGSALRFSEAEIAFLFPAPISRRRLIHYRLLSAQVGLGLSAVVLGLLVQRMGGGGGSWPCRIAGAWIVFATMDLHSIGIALTLARLQERGADVRRWRAGVLLTLALYVAALAWAAGRSLAAAAPLAAEGVEGAPALLQAALTSGPLPGLLLPFRILTGPLLASGARAFLVALPAALGLLALHYAWVLSAETDFAEGAMAAAARRAARVGGGRGGRDAENQGAEGARPRAARRTRGEPFRLVPQGRPELAFLWKNLLSIQNALTDRGFLRLGLLLAVVLLLGLRGLLAARARAGAADVSVAVVAIAAGVGFYTLVLGPQLARQDLRSDLPNIDLLKTYPLAGWQVALGELLAPTALLTGVLWLAILAATVALAGSRTANAFGPVLRGTIALCLGAVAPLACLFQLLVPNALMILFPGWYQASRSRGGGVEVMGQRLIFVFGQLIVAALALGPAAFAAALLIFASQWLIGPVAAVLLATAAVLAMIGGEVAVGIWWLGERFERFDLSSELKP